MSSLLSAWIPLWDGSALAGRLKGQHPKGRLSLPSLRGQRLDAGFPGAGTQAGDHLHTAAQMLGSDRPSTLPLFEKLSLDALPLVSDFAASTASGAKRHPFPETVLKQIRDFILPEHPQPAAGQPFFLDVIHKLDSDYPDTLKQGVPLGVDTPTLQSPGVWPLKSEIIGEEWDPVEAPPPVGHSNYPSADTFREEIRATFVEETPLRMVIGPCTRAEAAAHCHCKEEDLCPCPMAGIDESDKIRSIFDGSKGGQTSGFSRTGQRRPQPPR